MMHKIIRISKLILFPTLGILILYILFKDRNFDEIANSLKYDFNYWWIGISLIFGIFSHLVRAVRWQMLIATDVTARRRAEEQAAQQAEKAQVTSRLVTMGEMASSVAHELNQPLTAISNYCNGIISRVKAGAMNTDDLLAKLTLPYPADQMQSWKVDMRVNSSRNQGPDLIKPQS